MKRWLLAIGTRWQERSLRAKTLGLLTFSLVACGLAYGAYQFSRPKPDPVRPTDHPVKPYSGEPVALNRVSEIAEGFRGEVHPLLHGQTKLEVIANWIPANKDRHAGQPLAFDGYHFFLDMKPASERHTYTERDLSAFLPEELAGVGQMWSLDPEKMASLLRQFHPKASMHMDAQGRRVGPDGAFAVLRATSPSYLDIAFRIHAEFEITADLPKEMPYGRAPVDRGWYSPAYFSGQMIVNREKGTVEYFRVWLPTDIALNAHLTLKNVANFKSLSHFMAHVERMDLQGGNGNLATSDVVWKDSISQADAHRLLQRVFYKFMDIQWLPFGQIEATARDKNKPILAVVLWGNLDDQSC